VSNGKSRDKSLPFDGLTAPGIEHESAGCLTCDLGRIIAYETNIWFIQERILSTQLPRNSGLQYGRLRKLVKVGLAWSKVASSNLHDRPPVIRVSPEKGAVLVNRQSDQRQAGRTLLLLPWYTNLPFFLQLRSLPRRDLVFTTLSRSVSISEWSKLAGQFLLL
jgi:hypothetical protein